MRQVTPATAAGERFDAVVIGSGFGSSFFLKRFGELRPAARTLVLEWGELHSHAWQLRQGHNSAIAADATFSNATPRKPWRFNIGFGGGSACWWGNALRPQPSDFRQRSLYGVGTDWPVGYDELEPYFCDAEEIMAVSGPDEIGRLQPRSRPYPQPPHRLSAPDRLMRRAQPEHHFALPCARPRWPVRGRPACAAHAACTVCPEDAKFTVQNGMGSTFARAGVAVCTGARVVALETRGGVVSEAVYLAEGRERRVRGELFVLGANAIQAPPILLRSGIEDGPVGVGLHERLAFELEAELDGLDNFDGSTVETGINLALADGPSRRQAGAAVVAFSNSWTYGLRPVRGRERQTLPLLVVVEDLAQDGGRVRLGREPLLPAVTWPGATAYAQRGLRRALERLPAILAPLPVERLRRHGVRPTLGHLQGSLRMGREPGSSVVDGDLVHHRYRNLLVVGTSVLPSCCCAHPTLIAAALSLRAAERLAGC